MEAATQTGRGWVLSYEAGLRQQQFNKNQMPYKDPEKQKAYLKLRSNHLKRRSRNRAISEEVKSKPCVDCGKSYPPYVMDFDHVRGQKIRDVAWFVGSGSVQALLDEIAKCDVVCANCHRERTWKRNYKTSEELMTSWRERKPLSCIQDK